MRKKNRKENVKKSQIAINSLTIKPPSGSQQHNTSVQPYKRTSVQHKRTAIAFVFVFMP